MPWLLLALLIDAASQLALADSLITGYGDAAAIYGRDAEYGCKIDDSKGVQQVTWQKRSKDGHVQNLATYSERFGKQVNKPFKEKVYLAEASLTSSSISVKNVTWADSGCYICSFNAFPSGSKHHQACLNVQGISEVRTTQLPSIPEREGTKEVVVSCSTTGQPRPTIDWAFSDDHFSVSQGEATTTANDDGTFTSSRNVSVRALPGESGYVDCLVNTGRAGERRERVLFSISPEDKASEEEHRSRAVVIPFVACMLVLVTVAVTVMMVKKRFKQECGNSRISKICRRTSHQIT